MKLVSLFLISAISLGNYEPTWRFERQNLSASLQEPDLEMSRLRLACSRRGYLEIEILSGSNAEVPLIGPSKFILTIRGDLSPAGSITSLVHFRSLTDEFLREEGDVEVVGERAYRLHLNGARRVLQTLESSCMAVSQSPMGDNKSFQILHDGVSAINGRQHLRPRVGPRSAA